MSESGSVAEHYTSGRLLATLRDRLREDGVDPDRPSAEALAPYDQFHGRGLEATEELAGRLEIAPEHHLLDVGSGIGGPARYFAARFGCRVTGIDLTAEFCEAARYLTQALGMHDGVCFEQGDATNMPFDDAVFDGAYSMNVSMNIADKPSFYAELHRVLKPGAWLVLSEIARGSRGEVEYPTPWAATAANSHLATPGATVESLEAAGFDVRLSIDHLEAVLEFGARSRAMAERGEKPPNRAVALFRGEGAHQSMSNVARAVKAGAAIPIEVHCVRV